MYCTHAVYVGNYYKVKSQSKVSYAAKTGNGWYYLFSLGGMRSLILVCVGYPIILCVMCGIREGAATVYW